MRHARMFAGSLLGIGLLAAIANSCGGYGAEPLSIKTHRNIRNAVVRDGRLYLLSDVGEVLSLDHGAEQLKSYGKLDIRPGTLFEVSGNKALIGVQSRVYIADLAKPGSVAVSIFAEPITSLGVLDATHFFVVQKGEVHVVETASGKSLGAIALGKVEKADRRALSAHAHGNRLYVFADAETKQSVLAIDWKANRIETEYPLTGAALGQLRGERVTMEVSSDTILLGGVWYSYGIPMINMTKIDLATKNVSPIAVPRGQLGVRLVPGNPQRLTLVGDHAVYQIDKAGVIGRALPKTNGVVLTVWRQNAIFAGEGTLDIEPLTEPAPINAAQSK
jgi:hypothetical protein